MDASGVSDVVIVPIFEPYSANTAVGSTETAIAALSAPAIIFLIMFKILSLSNYCNTSQKVALSKTITFAVTPE